MLFVTKMDGDLTHRAGFAVVAPAVDLHPGHNPILTQVRPRPVQLGGRGPAQPRLCPAPFALHDRVVGHAHLGRARTGAQLPVFLLQPGGGLRATAGRAPGHARDLDGHALTFDLGVLVVVAPVGGGEVGLFGAGLRALLLPLRHLGQLGALVQGLEQ